MLFYHGPMKKKGKIVLFTILGILLVMLVVFFLGFWNLFGDEIKAIGTIKEIDDGLYYMEYEGDYGFDEYIRQGGSSSDSEMAEYIISFLSKGFYKTEVETKPNDYGCTAVTDGTFMGRNFDWDYGDAMIVRAKPENGYESISTVCLEFLGFEEGWKPEGMMNKFMALAGVYVPLDGMNEMGLCIADLIVAYSPETHQNTDKTDVTTVGGIRLVLDKAATVDEALEILKNVDMNSSIGTNHHYAISDSSGRCVAVEWVDGVMYVTETPILTNHIVAEGLGENTGKDESWKRFGMLEGEIKNNLESLEAMRDIMAKASYENETLWSIVYNKEDKVLDFYWKRDYSQPIEFQI